MHLAILFYESFPIVFFSYFIFNQETTFFRAVLGLQKIKQEIPYTPWLLYSHFSLLLTSSNCAVQFVTIEEPTSIPNYSLMFIVCIRAHSLYSGSRNFDKCVMSCIHPGISTLKSFTALTIPRLPKFVPRHLPQTPGNHSSFYHLHSFAFSRRSSSAVLK